MMYIINEYAQNFTTNYSFQQFPKNYPFLPIPNMYILFIEITLWLSNVSNTAEPIAIIHSNDTTLFEVVESTAC